MAATLGISDPAHGDPAVVGCRAGGEPPCSSHPLVTLSPGQRLRHHRLEIQRLLHHQGSCLLYGEKKKQSILAKGRQQCQCWCCCEVAPAGSDEQLKVTKSPFITSIQGTLSLLLQPPASPPKRDISSEGGNGLEEIFPQILCSIFLFPSASFLPFLPPQLLSRKAVLV